MVAYLKEGGMPYRNSVIAHDATLSVNSQPDYSPLVRLVVKLPTNLQFFFNKKDCVSVKSAVFFNNLTEIAPVV